MSDYDNMKRSGVLDGSIGSLNSTKEIIELVKSSAQNKDTVPLDQYEKLVNKFEEALSIIEAMKSKIAKLESNKMPSKDEVESMSSMLDLLSKLDDNAISRINKLGQVKNE